MIYIRACTLKIICLIVVLFSLNICASLGTNIWLSKWTDHMKTNSTERQIEDVRIYAAIGLTHGEKTNRSERRQMSRFVSKRFHQFDPSVGLKTRLLHRKSTTSLVNSTRRFSCSDVVFRHDSDGSNFKSFRQRYWQRRHESPNGFYSGFAQLFNGFEYIHRYYLRVEMGRHGFVAVSLSLYLYSGNLFEFIHDAQISLFVFNQ